VNLLYSEVEDELRSAVRALLTARAAWPAVLARTESERTWDGELWRALAGEVGAGGLLIGEELGGAGASLREAAVVAEETGRACAPVPFLGGTVAVALLAGCDSPAARDLLGGLAGASVSAAVAVPFTTPPSVPYEAGVTVAGDRLSGRVSSVADALGAEVLLVPAADGGVHAVAAGDAVRRPVTSLDMTRQLCDIELASVPARRVGEVAALRPALEQGAALLASEQLGLAERCLEMTVEYVTSRHQFGRPVGSYQGLKHRLAEVWVGITQARAVARYAASCAASGDSDTPVAVAVAQAHCGPVAVRAAEECVQMHGGIGFTWEHPAHLYLKRAKSSALAFGSAAAHRAALATLVELPG
jgi:alkylation response protein AidB-like acyl-CoA dehydrogenase